MPFAGTVTLRTPTLKAVVSDIAKSFKGHGFKGIVIVCQHLERANLKALQETASELSEGTIPTIVANPFFSHAETMNAMMKGEFPELDLHAGEWETAFCLWRYPKLVKMELLEKLPPNWVNLREKLYEQGCRDFVEAGGAKCYFGDPSLGNPELGKKIYQGLAKVLVEEVLEWTGHLPGSGE
jgi:creatinine amidohydrolase